jgi:hypothetical protein
MKTNIDKTKIMDFYETIEQKQASDSTDFFIKPQIPDYSFLIFWHLTLIASVPHNLRHDTPLEFTHTRSSPLILFRLCQLCVLPFATCVTV